MAPCAAFATGDMGVSKTGEKKDGWMPGMELHAKYTFLAEGVRGSLSKAAIAQYNLDADSDFQKFGIGIRNCGRLRRKIINPAMCSTHWAGRSTIRLAVVLALSLWRQFRLNRFCTHLNYKPHLSPYDEFQRFKMHPLFARRLRVEARSTARAQSPKAVISRCRSWHFRWALIGARRAL